MPALTHSKRSLTLKALSHALSLAGLLLICGPELAQAAEAQAEAPAAAASGVQNSRMDKAIFFQVLVGEFEAGSGDVGSAYGTYLDLARKYRNPELFKRTVDIARQARAGEEALTAAKAGSRRR
ncbi:MAG: hypothetical protein EOP38_19145 [Rubrivivax sp.]|nr:MAG: hypothetical protein EOP38_19145 [Rubrivivax sp.]